MGRLREPALLAVMDGEPPKIVKLDPDPQGDAQSAEHHSEVGQEVRVIRKAVGILSGLGLTTQEKTVRYRVPSLVALRDSLMKAMRAGDIETGAVGALNAGRLLEGVLLKAMPEARRVDDSVPRHLLSDAELYERRMRR